MNGSCIILALNLALVVVPLLGSMKTYSPHLTFLCRHVLQPLLRRGLACAGPMERPAAVLISNYPPGALTNWTRFNACSKDDWRCRRVARVRSELRSKRRVGNSRRSTPYVLCTECYVISSTVLVCLWNKSLSNSGVSTSPNCATSQQSRCWRVRDDSDRKSVGIRKLLSVSTDHTRISVRSEKRGNVRSLAQLSQTHSPDELWASLARTTIHYVIPLKPPSLTRVSSELSTSTSTLTSPSSPTPAKSKLALAHLPAFALANLGLASQPLLHVSKDRNLSSLALRLLRLSHREALPASVRVPCR